MCLSVYYKIEFDCYFGQLLWANCNIGPYYKFKPRYKKEDIMQWKIPFVLKATLHLQQS